MKRLALAIAAICAAGASYADTTTFTDTDNVLASTNLAMSPLTLGLYDPALHGGAALTKATFTLSLEAVIKLVLTNTTTTPQSTNISAFVNMSFGSTTSAPLTAAIAADAQFPLVVGISTGVVTLAPVAFAPLNMAMFGGALLTSSDTLIFTTTDAAVLASLSLVGGGDLGLSCSTRTPRFEDGNGGNINIQQTTTARCTGSVEYSHEAPEPTSLGLIGLGLASAGLLARRRALKA